MQDKIIIWLVMPNELENVEKDFYQLSQITGKDNFAIYPIAVENWNADLSPWEYCQGNKNFAGGASVFLEKIMEHRKQLAVANPQAEYILGGYSLAGLFSLWCGYETDAFDIIVSCSGSLWFPNFVKKYQEKNSKAKAVYMSLGNKEKRCRDKMMADIERRTFLLFDSIKGIQKEFVMEQGNHFTECRERMLRGFAWALNSD